MYRNFQVREVNVEGMKGYQIQGTWRACSDSFWEDIAHGAIFLTRSRAEAFLKRIQGSPTDGRFWGKPIGFSVSQCDYIQTPVSVYSVL